MSQTFFDAHGTFAEAHHVVNPRPDNLFNNIQSAEAIGDFIPSSNRERVHECAFLITLAGQPSPLIFVSFMAAYMPLFWQCELLSPQGLESDEDVYTGLWQEKQREGLLFNSFGKYMRPLQLRAKGRLLKIMLFLLFLEADEGKAASILERLQCQSLQPAVSANWNQFTSPAIVELNSKSGSLSTMLSKKYGFIGGAIECLTLKRKGMIGHVI